MTLARQQPAHLDARESGAPEDESGRADAPASAPSAAHARAAAYAPSSASAPAPVIAAAWAELPPGGPELQLPSAPSFLLRGRGLQLAAAGEALRLTGPHALALAQRAQLHLRGAPPPHLPGPFVFVQPFAAPPGHAWRGLPAPVAFAPALLLVQAHKRRTLIALSHASDADGDGLDRAEALLASALAGLRPRSGDAGAPLHARAVEGPQAKAGWVALVRRALAAIERGEFAKVVLARALEVQLAAPPEPHALCDALARRFPTCNTFWLQGDGAAFAGASPETLAVLEGDRLSCDALAGTSAPGAALLEIDKERREHRSVVDGLRATLLPLAAPSAIDAAAAPRLLRLANVDHLYTEVRARLRAGVGIAEVVAALHPTPAVAGAPREASLRFIAAHEGLDRGLYAGLVGLVGPHRSELHVALRSALLRGTSARLFVGAGIVAGSDPDAEWEETALKAQAVLGALGVAR